MGSALSFNAILINDMVKISEQRLQELHCSCFTATAFECGALLSTFACHENIALITKNLRYVLETLIYLSLE